MRKFLNKFLAIVLITIFLAGCQPTPEEGIVVQRNELENKIENTAAPADVYETPEHWTDTVTRGNLVVNIDTDVTLPDVSQYPVVKLEPITFSQERIDELVAYFAGEHKLYAWPSVFTKEDYEAQLVEAKRGQEIDGEYIVNESTIRHVEALEEKIKNAPEDSPRVYTDTKLTYQTDLDGNVNYDAGPNSLNVGVEFGDGNEATIFAQNFTEGFGNSTSFSFRLINGYTTESFYQQGLLYGDESESGFEGYGEIFDTIDIDKEDARAQAEKLIADLGINDMALAQEEKAILHSLHNLWGVDNNQPDRVGYVFNYVRESGGISGFQLLSWGSNGNEPPPDYSPPFFQEMLTIAISENGIDSFNWSGLAQVIETVSENVSLLPFEDIQQSLIDQIYYQLAPQSENEYKMEVFVNSAELHVGYISVQNNPRQAMLVPMWVFHTYETTTDSDKNTYMGNFTTYQFNAIDGGVIMPSMGVIAGEE